MIKQGRDYNDNRSLLRDYISEEELWACTTCNACATECPININHPSVIIDMRRYLVLEEGSAPGELKAVFNNIENNGAPWQYSSEDRLNWARDIGFSIPVMAEMAALGKQPEYLFWVGCAGAFDDRYKKVVRSFATILDRLGISYAVLGKEETCTGDPARRAGNEMLFQMQAFQVIDILNKYGVKKILTTCPHCYNVFKNEYPDLGGSFEVINYVKFLDSKLEDGSLSLKGLQSGKSVITYHDPCYLGRYQNFYDEPRRVAALGGELVEAGRSRETSFCCGAGGGLVFLGEEKGKRISHERTEQLLATGAATVAAACPFCQTMLGDAFTALKPDGAPQLLDIAEIAASRLAGS